MSATGILRAEGVVFYHPLDSFTERTQGQTWTGTGAFVAGRIGNADSGVAASAPSFGEAIDVDMSNMGPNAIDAVDSSRALICHKKSTTTKVVVRVATVSGGDVTLGPEYEAGDQGAYAGTNVPIIVYHGGGKLVVFFRDTGGTRYSRVGTVSGTDVTFGTANACPSLSDYWCAEALSSTLGLMGYYANIGGGVYCVHARAYTLSGLNATFGAATQINSVNTSYSSAIARLTDSTAVIVFPNGSSGVGAKVLTVSGTAVSAGAEAPLTSSAMSSYYPSVVAMSSDTVVAWWANASGTGDFCAVGKVSGTAIAFGTAKKLPSYNGGVHGLDALDSSRFVLCWGASASYEPARALGPSAFLMVDNYDTSGSRYSLIGTVSGTDITYGGTTTTTYTGNLVAGTISTEASATAPTPDAYPAAAGQGHVAIAMWAKNLTKGSSAVTVRRDYEVTLTATSVTLGPASAVWSGAEIGSPLMSTMNDGNMNLLVLDFVHTGSGNWTLSTSLNGGPWVGHGTGTGTRTTSPASAAPMLQIQYAVGGQWVDELVMWAGTFDTFTTEELANLHDLADVFGDPMDQYEDNYGAPLCWQATARMPDGSVWRDSGSGPCPPVVRVPRGASDVVVTDDRASASPRVIEG